MKMKFIGEVGIIGRNKNKGIILVIHIELD